MLVAHESRRSLYRFWYRSLLTANVSYFPVNIPAIHGRVYQRKHEWGTLTGTIFAAAYSPDGRHIPSGGQRVVPRV
ncbi:hypothetical protein BDN67DRAFT_966877 [Paxillus ammoniavirescens]|nr:hypothetical protein BDN67DRAFT_966877 [Paxillus ammoniavirescens]